MTDAKPPKPRPLAIVLMIIRHGNAFLFIKRRKPPYQGLWAIPAGKIEFGEHVEDTAVREAREETGLACAFKRVCGLGSELLYEDGRVANHFLVFACELDAPSRKTVESDEGELRWFTLDDFERDVTRFIPNDIPMLKEFVLGHDGTLRIHKTRMRKDGNAYELESFHA